jgi:hypothetical protein
MLSDSVACSWMIMMLRMRKMRIRMRTRMRKRMRIRKRTRTQSWCWWLTAKERVVWRICFKLAATYSIAYRT